jgi:hypothetical protein
MLKHHSPRWVAIFIPLGLAIILLAMLGAGIALAESFNKPARWLTGQTGAPVRPALVSALQVISTPEIEATAAPTDPALEINTIPIPTVSTEPPNIAAQVINGFSQQPLLFIGVTLIPLALIVLFISLVAVRRGKRKNPRQQEFVPEDIKIPLPAAAWLEGHDLSGQVRELQLKSLDEPGEIIGRPGEGVTLPIDDSFPNWETVSRQHARIYREPNSGCLVIEDNNSRNGVYVQGQRTGRNLLKDNWTVRIGGVELVYRERQENVPSTSGNSAV